MTRDELIEKVARSMDSQLWLDKDNWIDIPSLTLSRSLQFAEVAINTIFDALKEPTDEMCFAAEEYDWEANHDITFSECFVSMLSASPLAPEE